MKSKNEQIDGRELSRLFKEAEDKLRAGHELEGKDGALRPLLKRLLEAGLTGEIDSHVEQSRPNRRNGKTSKKLKTSYGPVQIETPRDREGSFDPILVPKRQRSLGASIDNKVLSLYSLGMSYRDIRSHVEEMYGLDLSPSTLSAITDQIWEEVDQWRNRPLDPLYACVWLDAMFFKVREEGRVITKAVYMVLGRRMDGTKELLGMYLGQSESAKFWMQVLSDLQVRGVHDILICCIDNLKGFVQAIQSLFPTTDVQLCIVHQIRNSLRYIVWTDRKSFMKDLRHVYQANNEAQGKKQLEKMEEKWGAKYGPVFKSWRRYWSELSTLYNYPESIRRMIYTTNVIEGFHRQIRKVTKTKGAFPNDRSLYKLLFLAQQRITKDWHKRSPRDWKKCLGALAIFYEEKLLKHGFL